MMNFRKIGLRLLLGIVMGAVIAPGNIHPADVDLSDLIIAAYSGQTYALTVVLKDPQGRRIGLIGIPSDAEPAWDISDEFFVKEIPNSGAGVETIDSHVTLDPGEPVLQILVGTPIDGTYTLTVGGTALTAYTVEIHPQDRSSVPSGQLMKFRGVTTVGATSEYQITYTATPGIANTAVRAATFPSAKQDIDLSFKIGWIKNEGLENSLIMKLQNAEADQSRGDTIAAKNTLNAFINEVKAQAAGNGIDPDADTMLAQDAQYLIDHL